jgi:hypothetical protein
MIIFLMIFIIEISIFELFWKPKVIYKEFKGNQIELLVINQ